MAEITFDGLNENSLIMQWNTDNYGNPKSIHINNEIQQISPTHNVIQLAQVPDEYYRVKFIAEGIDGWLLEVRNLRELENINQFYVDYNHGIVYFHEEMAGRLVRADYYGRGVMFLSDARIFHKSGDSFATTLDEVLEKSKDAFKLLESTGGLNEAIELLDQKAQEGTDVADRLEDFISETEFYGYTIILSREAFVVRAKEDGNLHDGEMEDLTADVVVYKGAKSLTVPDLNIRIYSTTNCECEIDDQTIKITQVDVNAIKGQAIIEIDCGDGLIAYRTIEVTKVFDGVSQFNVEVTNSFYSFNATHSGKVEEEQSVTCEFNVTKANELYTDYVVGVQNMPTGMTCNLAQPTKGATSVTFTVLTGSTLPDNGSISLVFQMNDNTVITKTFVFSKAKQGLSAKSLMLAGNQIIHYENADYSGTPTPLRTSIVAQVTDLSGTPVWSYLEGEQWIVIDGQNGTSLNLYHNDRIWTDKHELTIKCELDGFSDEITLIKIANGAMGLSSYSVILSNESTTLRVSTDGTIPTEELTSQYTRITAFKGSEQITPTKITVPTSDVYEVSVSGATINLIDVDTSTTTVNIPIEIILDNTVKIDKIWSISKTEPGEHGAPGAVYSMNIEGGTRAITYNQLNENPRPTFSGVFTATIYENGNDITSQVASWYWTTEGHLTGTSIENSFIPEIKDTFDKSILNNSVTVTAIYNHMPISYTVPIVVSKDVSGLDWVTDWDSTKVTIKDTEILTPKIFAGTYNKNTDSITGVAIGTDVLNDGQVQGITAWQDNEVSFLLGTDGSLLIGNPFDVDGSGLSYNDGRFVLNVDDMSIAGVTVPTWDDMEEQLSNQGQNIIDAIQGNIDNMNNTLNDMTNYVDHILQDELITELEKVQLDSLFEVVQQEAISIQAQYDSVINNPYLPDEEVTNLEECYANYVDAYNNIVDVYNDVFGEGTVEEIEYTIPEEEYLETSDFSFEQVDVVDADENLDDDDDVQSENPVMLADVNQVSLDTLTTKDGYVLVTLNGEVITMITENTLLDFEDAVAVLRDYSSILQQAISEALLSISENRAAMLVEEAKEEVRQEIADVDSALSDLETTMNGSFKSGLIGEQSKAILNERLTQLDIEKKDVDGQYEVLSQNSALDALSKEKLSLAKTDLDAAHDVLVAKINQVIIDNLMTDSELQAVNDLISEYANELQNYSKVAQECNATIAVNTANLAVEAITDEDVFNKVTNYGVTQGLFIKDEKVYINSEYINTRNFKAVTDDGKETFKIDENGEVSITAKSLAITGSSNLATQDYVNTQIENLTNTNITFTLSNEFQIIPTDESYYPLSEGTYSIKITGYKGSSEEITDFTIGTVTSSDSAIVSVVSNINKTVVLSVSPDAPLGDSNGYVDIPITYDNRQFNKRWSWAVSKQGNQATYVTITGEQFFKYTNNYTGTPTPSQIVLTANVFNSTETGKWQYNDNGTWVDWKDGNGNTVTTKNLTIYPTDATLATTKSVFVRYYVDSVFDTYSVTCISDGSNGTNGKGISTIVNKYLATNSSSDVTTSTSGWTSVVQEISASKKYLWNYEIITYTDNSTTETTPCIIGTYGEDGETGVGITEITEYYLTSNSTNVSDVLTGNWSTSMQIPNKDAKYLWNYSEIEYTNGNKSAQSPRIIGNFAEDGASGSDAYTVLLTNENHTFVANHLGATTEQIVYSDVIAYKGTTPITPTIGTLPTVTGLTLAKSGVRITIKSNTGTSLEDNGSFDIPITVDGQTFTKSFSWTKVKDGQDGETGASAKSVNIVASNMVFKSTDGGTTFSPNDIKLTAQYQNLTHSRWQYSIDGGTTWINVYDGDNGGWQGGITGTSDSLTITIPKTCTFFTDTTTSVVFKAISTDESFYDVITITKLYDVADVDFEGIAEDVAQEKVNALDTSLNQQSIYNRLTNNGTTQGIYLENGQLYINGEYINSKNFRAEDNNGNQTFLIDSNGNVHINANTFAVSGNSVPTTQDVLNMIDEYGQAENLLLTPNFNAGSLTNWSWSVSSYVFVSTTYKHDGNTACKLQYTGSSNVVMLSTKHMSIDRIDGGATYKVSMYIYCEAPSATSGTYYLRVNGNPIGSTSSTIIADRTFTSANLVANQWVEISFEFTTTQEYTAPQLLITGTGAINAWVTDFALQKQGAGMNQEQIVDILNGAGQGFYIVDGQALINAEYIQTGTLAADLIKVRVDEGSNLLPINYITMEHAINEDIYIQEQNGIPYGELSLPTFAGGASVDASNTILGYSKVSLQKGKSYWFSCRCYAQWGNDTKPSDGVGTSTAGKSKYGIQTGNNLDIVLYDNTSSSGMNTGRNLLDHTDGTDTPHIYSGAYVSSGFQVSNSTAYNDEPGHLMLVTIDSTAENYYRFMAPNPGNMYGLEPGETYTLSGKACGTTSEITIRHQYSSDSSTWLNMDGMTIPLKGEDYWQSFELTFTIPYEATGYYLSFQDYNQVYGKNCYLAELKLEKSNKATPWCKSPVDNGESNPTTIEKSKPVYILGSVHDFNDFIDITDGANEISVYGADGMMYRTWTTLINRIYCTQDFEGYMYICLDASGFDGGDYGWFYFSKLQLTDGSLNDEYYDLDYLTQLKEKRIELADSSYYKNLICVDGITMDNGNVKSYFDFSETSYELNDNGFKYRINSGYDGLFAGMSKSWYQYDGGSSGMITGYDDIFGFGCDKYIEGNREGIFVGIHNGFQIANSTAYGRPDIYVHTKYDGTTWDDKQDWQLLGERIEPRGLVRRDDYSNITTQTCLCIAQSTNTGGETYNGSTVFSEAMYNATGNGQLINVNPSINRIYVGNTKAGTIIETAGALMVNDSQYGERQVLVNGIQCNEPQVNIYTGSSIEIWADRDYSTTTERVWIGAGNNAITITSSGTGSNVDACKFNGHIMINGSNLHDKIYIGAQDNAEKGREIKDWGVHSYNLYNKSLLNGDGTSSAYGGYWSILTFGNGQSGSAQLAIDWTSGGKGFYMRSLRDTGDNWFKWKRIGNSDWILDSTSDERYKRAISNVSTEDCYNMVKNIELHTYLLLTEEERYLAEKGELDVDELFLRTVTSEGIHHSLQMGVLAQDMLKYSCGTYVVNQDVLRDENGELISDRYGIDAYNYASAILGGLQEEIKVRDEQYEELKKENEDLKARLEKLEKLILKGE